jgi:hypothetical protein
VLKRRGVARPLEPPETRLAIEPAERGREEVPV